MLPIQRRVAQRDLRPVQRFQPADGRFGRERIIGGEEECLETGDTRPSPRQRSRGRSPPARHRCADRASVRSRPFRTGLARHEVRHVGERDEAGTDDDHLDTAPRIGLGDPLAAQLAEAIGIGRARRMRLVDRQIVGRHVRIAVIQPEHRTAGAMDHAANAGLKAGLEQVPGAHRVDLHGRRIVGGDRPVDAAKMHHDFDAAQTGSQQRRGRADRPGDNRAARRCRARAPCAAPAPARRSVQAARAPTGDCYFRMMSNPADVRATSSRRSRGGTDRAPATPAPRRARTARTCRASASASG